LIDITTGFKRKFGENQSDEPAIKQQKQKDENVIEDDNVIITEDDTVIDINHNNDNKKEEAIGVDKELEEANKEQTENKETKTVNPPTDKRLLSSRLKVFPRWQTTSRLTRED
jgi:hypothetical protein